MITTRTHTLTATLATAAVLGISACSGDSTGFPTPTIVPTTTGGADTTATPEPEPGDTAGGPIVDPCTITWAAFPAKVRPADTAATGTSTPPRPTENYTLGCLFTNNTQPGYDPAKPARDGDFAARLTWGTGLDTSKISQGAKPTTWNNQPGGLRPHGTPTGTSCLAYATSGTGHAVIQIINKRYTTTKACDIADTLMNALTTPPR